MLNTGGQHGDQVDLDTLKVGVAVERRGWRRGKDEQEAPAVLRDRGAEQDRARRPSHTLGGVTLGSSQRARGGPRAGRFPPAAGAFPPVGSASADAGRREPTPADPATRPGRWQLESELQHKVEATRDGCTLILEKKALTLLGLPLTDLFAADPNRQTVRTAAAALASSLAGDPRGRPPACVPARPSARVDLGGTRGP